MKLCKKYIIQCEALVAGDHKQYRFLFICFIHRCTALEWHHKRNFKRNVCVIRGLQQKQRNFQYFYQRQNDLLWYFIGKRSNRTISAILVGCLGVFSGKSFLLTFLAPEWRLQVIFIVRVIFNKIVFDILMSECRLMDNQRQNGCLGRVRFSNFSEWLVEGLTRSFVIKAMRPSQLLVVCILKYFIKYNCIA